jgi:hypothetical protein
MANTLGLLYYALYLGCRVAVMVVTIPWLLDLQIFPSPEGFAYVFSLLYFSRSAARISFGGSTAEDNCPAYQAQQGSGEEKKIKTAMMTGVLIFIGGMLLWYFLEIPKEVYFCCISMTWWRNISLLKWLYAS